MTTQITQFVVDGVWGCFSLAYKNESFPSYHADIAMECHRYLWHLGQIPFSHVGLPGRLVSRLEANPESALKA